MQELNQTIIEVYISGKNYSKYVQFPFKVSNLLDEQLDESSLTLIGVEDKILKPLTAVTVTVKTQTSDSQTQTSDSQTSKKTYSMLVAEDKVDEIPTGSGKYKHELYLIEQTKFLECFVVRSLGYVNPSKRIYERVDTAFGTVSTSFDDGHLMNIYGTFNFPDLKTTPIYEGVEYVVPSPSYLTSEWESEAFPYTEGYYTYNRVTYGETTIVNNGVTKVYQENLWDQPTQYFTPTAGVCDITIKTNVLIYDVENPPKIGVTPPSDGTIFKKRASITCRLYLSVIPSVPDTPLKWNARTVIRRALICAETLRKGEEPRFKLEGDVPYYNNGEVVGDDITEGLTGIAKELQTIETPEFQFTQSTLREVLQEVGRYIHAEPRLLDDGVITFDKLGSGELSTFTEDNYASKSYQQGVDRYATNLHSTVGNFVNSINYANGVLIEPFVNGYKTVRTEDLYVRLEDTNVFIQTLYPIRAIRKLECGFVDNFGTPPFDITSFVYESAEYQRLSSYEGSYPMAKAWALYYTIGQNGVYGLNFKEQTATFASFQNYAILNILNAVTGSSVGWTDTANNNYMVKLAFRITYEPIYPATAQQSKSYIGDLDKPATMVYNQAQNMVESHYYGENMKGAIARLGNVDKVLTYVKNGLFEPPQVGQILLDGNDEFYISAVATEFFPFYTKFSMSLSKDFNRYSDYVKVNSEKRMYEISERQATDSHITYKDYVVIGDNNYKKGTINDGLLENTNFLKEIFTQDGTDGLTVTMATLQGKDRLGNLLQEVILPVQKSAIGNSALFTIKYKDNYSAGDNVVKDSNGNLWQNGVAYGDYFGNVEYLDFTLWDKMISSPDSLAEQTEQGNALPIKNGSPLNNTVSTVYGSNQAPLWIKKGSTEIPSLDYQMDFVTNCSNIIIGSAIVKNFPLLSGINNADHKAKLYVLPQRINKFDKVIDTSSGTLVNDWSLSIIDWSIWEFRVATTQSASGLSWALVNGLTNELLIGCNKTITNTTDIFDGLKMFVKHDIFKDKI